MSADKLVGEVLTHVDECGDEILLTCASGKKFIIQHRQDCCESVSIEGRDGEWKELYGKVLTVVEHDEECNPDNREYYDSATLTTITFKADENTVVSRWFGTSNGYYSESVDIEELSNGRR